MSDAAANGGVSERHQRSAMIEALYDLGQAKMFMGREFLLWFWHRIDRQGGLWEVEDSGGEVLGRELWIDDRLVLEAASGKTLENVLKGGDPGHSDEARVALAAGKSVRELRLGVQLTGVGETTFVLNAQDLSPRAVRLPDLSEAECAAGVEHPLAGRQAAVVQLCRLVDALFATFLRERLSPEWPTNGAARIAAWLTETPPNTLHA